MKRFLIYSMVVFLLASCTACKNPAQLTQTAQPIILAWMSKISMAVASQVKVTANMGIRVFDNRSFMMPSANNEFQILGELGGISVLSYMISRTDITLGKLKEENVRFDNVQDLQNRLINSNIDGLNYDTAMNKIRISAILHGTHTVEAYFEPGEFIQLYQIRLEHVDASFVISDTGIPAIDSPTSKYAQDEKTPAVEVPGEDENVGVIASFKEAYWNKVDQNDIKIWIYPSVDEATNSLRFKFHGNLSPESRSYTVVLWIFDSDKNFKMKSRVKAYRTVDKQLAVSTRVNNDVEDFELSIPINTIVRKKRTRIIQDENYLIYPVLGVFNEKMELLSITNSTRKFGFVIDKHGNAHYQN